MTSLFFVTTLGQARTAVSVGLENNLNIEIVVLYSSNVKVREAIQDYLTDNNMNYSLVQLPNRVTIPSPRTIRKMRKVYSGILESKEYVKDIWVSNRNTHYRLLIDLCYEKNLPVCFFEEGVGTYKSESNFSWQSNIVSLKNIYKLTDKFINNRKKKFKILYLVQWILNIVIFPFLSTYGLFLLFKNTYVVFSNQVFCSTMWKKFGGKINKQVSKYYDNHQDFSGAALSFPDKVPNLEYKDSYKLDLSCTLNDNSIEKCLSLLSDVKATAIFASQKYSKGSDLYYESVASSLISWCEDNENDVIAIKFHPKESPSNIEKLISCIEVNSNIHVEVFHDEINSFTLEEVIATNKFNKIISITSTSLIYARMFSSSIDVISIFDSISNRMGSKLDSNMVADSKVISNFEHVRVL